MTALETLLDLLPDALVARSDIRDALHEVQREAAGEERERLFREHLKYWHHVNVDADRYTYTACSACRMFAEPSR